MYTGDEVKKALLELYSNAPNSVANWSKICRSLEEEAEANKFSPYKIGHYPYINAPFPWCVTKDGAALGYFKEKVSAEIFARAKKLQNLT